MKIPALPGFDPQAFEKYFKNTGWLMVARTGSLVIKMLVTSFAIPNYLGDSGNGVFNYPLAFIGFFVAASALGMDSFVTRQLLQEPQRQHILLGTAFRLRLAAGFIALPLIYLTYFLAASFTQNPPAASFEFIAIVSFVCLFQSVHIIDSYFQSRIQGKYIMYIQVGANLVSAGLKMLLILLQLPIEWFIWMLLLDVVLLSAGYVYMYQKTGNSLRHWEFDIPTAKHLLRHSWPLAFSAVFITLYMKIDQLMIDAYLGEAVLGVYSTVVQLSEGWYFIPMAIVTALFPAIMNARRDDPARYRRRLENLYELMVFISLSIAIVMSIGSFWIYEWFYKAEYAGGAPALAIHVWAGIFVFLNVASGQYLIAEGYTKISLMRALLGATVNIGLNIVWIPQYGMIGAAYATLGAYAATALFVLLIPKTRDQGFAMLRALTFISLIKRLSNK